MPRYKYECESCDKVVIVLHSINENYTTCGFCGIEGSMKKLLSTPLYMVEDSTADGAVGDITKEYIEANREILKQQQEEAKEFKHEPT
jgi:putative FmdB family regulatory protein